MRFLILGHPRSGTAYTAALMRHLGYEVGHERVMRDGVSAIMPLYNPEGWGLIKRGDYRLSFKNDEDTKIIQVVRNPRAVAASDLGRGGPAASNMTRYIPTLKAWRNNGMELMLMSIVIVNRHISCQKPDLIVHVERAGVEIPRWLDEMSLDRDIVGNPPPTNMNHKEHRELTAEDWSMASSPVMSEFKLHEKKYGYS